MSANTSASFAPRRIHVLFKTHLDIGFTALARDVVSAYVDNFIPRAIAMARELREKHGEHRFVWTTGSWLIHHSLEAGGARRRRELEAAIVAGDIRWHGLPFTTHTELIGESLFRAGLGLSRELDARFGVKTTAGKMTDVPGHTRALVPLLAEAGIEFLHLGVNPASRPPAVPDAFRWRHDDGSELAVVYCKSGYGDLAEIPGCDEALTFAHTGDNHGPCTLEDVETFYASLRERFPGAELRASTLSHFTPALRRAKEALPVVTQELGDTWIHGVGTDPLKVARYRALARWHAGLDEAALGEKEAVAARRFARRLLLVPEHTWGLDVKLSMGWEKKYDKRLKKSEFAKARSEAPYRRMEESWREQRAYVDDAVAALRGTRLEREARARLAAVEPAAEAETGGWRKLAPGEVLATPLFEAAWSGADGSLAGLRERKSGRRWADARHPLGALRYEVYGPEDYAQKWRCYNQRHEQHRDWSVPDFLKPGLERAVKESQAWTPRLKTLETRETPEGVEVRARLGFPAEASRAHGCPRRAEILYRFEAGAPRLRMIVRWFEKPATRVAEGMWLAMTPRLARDGAWRLKKIGSWIDPRDVVRDGNRTLHAVEACRYLDADGKDALLIENLCAPLVAPGKPSLVRFTNRLPRVEEGLHFNLHNNTWGTNFPLWYEDDARFEFVLSWRE